MTAIPQRTRARRGRFFIQIRIDDEDRWSTFDIVNETDFKAPVFAQAIHDTLFEHPTWGRHELRIATTAQLRSEGGVRALFNAEAETQTDWLPEHVQLVRAFAFERLWQRAESKDYDARSGVTPTRSASRAIETTLEALEHAIRADKRAMRLVAEDAHVSVETVRKVRNGDTLRAMLVTTDTSYVSVNSEQRMRAKHAKVEAHQGR